MPTPAPPASALAALAALAALGVLATAGATPAGAARLGRDVVPTRQSVALELDPARDSYAGVVEIALEVARPAARLTLHAEDLAIGRVTLRAGGREAPARAEPESAGVLRIVPAEPLAPGPATLTIAFTNAFDTRASGLYRVTRDGLFYAFTHFQADDARRAFPCFDEPSFKIPWRVTLTVPDGLLALGNAPLARDSSAGGWRTVTFAETPPLPSYLVAFAAGPFDTLAVTGTSVPCRIVAPRGGAAHGAEAARVTPPLLAALEAWFEERIPFDKLDLVAVPEFWYGAMENPGAVTFAESRLLLDPARATAGERARLARLVAHELAHMWFGNLVTMAWWDDLWLNEAFATWLGNRIADRVFPEHGTAVAEIEARASALRADARASARAVRAPVATADNLLHLADPLAYQKGRSVLEMFERWLGPETFRDGVLDHLDAHRWGNANGDDLWEALSAAQRRGAGRLVPRRLDAGDVARAMPAFLDRPGVPLVTVEPVGRGRLRLTQRRFTRAGAGGGAQPLWRIPVALAWGEGAVVRRRTVLLAKRSMEVKLDGAATLEWIHPNAGESGYYRWSLPPALLAALVAHAPRVLDARERAALPDHLAALLDAGELAGDAFLAALARLVADPDPRVALSALRAIGAARGPLVGPAAAPDFAAWVRGTLGPVAARLGPEARAGEDAAAGTLRAELLDALADWGGDPAARARGEALARALLAGERGPDAALDAVAPGIAALHGDRALFDACASRARTAATAAERGRWLRALARFREPALIEAALAFALEAPLPPQEVLAIPLEMAARPETQERAWRFVEERWRTIAARVPPMFLGLLPRFAGGCSRERAAAARRFFEEDSARQGSGWQRSLEEAAEDAAACADLRAREAARVAAWLRAGRAAGDAPAR